MPFRFFIAFALALTVLAQDAPPRATGAGVNFYSLDNEIALGAQLAETVRRDIMPLDNAAVQQYVTHLGLQLAAQSGGPNFTYTFTVVSALPAGGGVDPTHEPLALPGGPIFIPADLIREARGEAEFAGMLAHAIAHIASRHYTRQLTRQELMQIGAEAAVKAQEGTTGAAIRQGAELAIPLAYLRFQQTFESQADDFAVQTMAKAGYDPAALATYIRRTQPTHESTGTAKVFSPMPPVEQRVSAIQAAATALPAQIYSSGGDFEAIQRAVK